MDSIARFLYFLETGRAVTLQECMNLYEQDLQWEQFKEFQSRIERNIMATVYYLNSEAAATLENKPKEQVENMLETIAKRLRNDGKSGNLTPGTRL
jgi:hypothetical protein